MAEDIKQIKEVKAFARGIHMSPRKVRLVVDVVKGMTVEDALTNLAFMSKKAALPVKKLVDSAVANAQHNFQIASDRLFVKSLTVDGGQVMERFKPRAQGRAFPIRRRTSHINLILGVADKAIASKRKIVTAVKEETKVEPLAEPAAESKSRFGFLRGKKESDPTQVPPKQDVKGKHYTSFDRRAGE